MIQEGLNDRSQITAAVPAGGYLVAGKWFVAQDIALRHNVSGVVRACLPGIGSGIDVDRPHRLDKQHEEMRDDRRADECDRAADKAYRFDLEAIPKAAQDQPGSDSADHKRYNERPPAK